MKTLKTIALTALFILNYLLANCQEKIPINEPNYNRPKLFDDLPQKIILTLSDMEPLFDLSVGSPVMAKLAKSFQFKGMIVSKSGDDRSAVRSLVIRSSTRQEAILTFTKVINTDGSFVYQGRIVSMSSSDAYEIVKENDQYFLQKRNFYEMVRE